MSLLADDLKTMVAARLLKPPRVGTIYYIACPDTLRLKIGYTGGNPATRLKALRTGSPTDIRLIAAHPGTQTDERYIHGFFEEQRLHGEWFEVDEQLFEFMSYVAWAAVVNARYRGEEPPAWALMGLESAEEVYDLKNTELVVEAVRLADGKK